MISTLQTLVYVIFAATLANAALPPGYEDVLFCPKNYCLERNTRFHMGPRSSLYHCKSLITNQYMRPLAWGTRKYNAKSELIELLQREFHENKCDDVVKHQQKDMYDERRFNEQVPYTADENYDLGTMHDERRFNEKYRYTADTDYDLNENDIDRKFGGRSCSMEWPLHKNCWCNENEGRMVCGKELLKYLKPDKDGMVQVRGGRGWRYVNPITGRAKFPGPTDSPVYTCGKNEQCASPSRYCSKCVGKDTTQDSFDSYLENFVDAKPNTDVSSEDASVTSSIAAAPKLLKKKGSDNTKTTGTHISKIAMWCGTGAFVALIIGGLIYRKVRSQREQFYIDIDKSNFISKHERKHSMLRSSQIYESPHIVNIAV